MLVKLDNLFIKWVVCVVSNKTILNLRMSMRLELKTSDNIERLELRTICFVVQGHYH